jgi:hypothetical protein
LYVCVGGGGRGGGEEEEGRHSSVHVNHAQVYVCVWEDAAVRTRQDAAQKIEGQAAGVKRPSG